MSAREHPRVLITGSSSGFGRRTAEELARRGATVFATMREVDGKNAPVAETLRRWADGEGLSLHVLELDVTDESSVESAVVEAVERASGLDVVVNNAGVGMVGVGESCPPDQLHRLFDVNLYGVHRVNRATLPHMREAGRGLVVYVSSGLGRVVFPFLGPYNATKFALEALAETMSYELGPLGIDTVIVQPGAYGTSFGENMSPAEEQGRLEGYGPVTGALERFDEMFDERERAGEMGDPAEVAGAIADIVYAPSADRPLRLPVGTDMEEAVGAVNEAAGAVQSRLLEEMGFGDLLRTPASA